MTDILAHLVDQLFGIFIGLLLINKSSNSAHYISILLSLYKERSFPNSPKVE